MIKRRKRNQRRSNVTSKQRIVWCVLGLTVLVTVGVAVGMLMRGHSGRNVRLKQATLALQKGRPDLALRLISPVLSAEPNDLQARMLVIRTRMKMVQFRRALSHANQLVMLYPDRIDLRRVRIDVLLSVLHAQLSALQTDSEVYSLGSFETLFATAAVDVEVVSSGLEFHELQMIRVRLESLQIRKLKQTLAFSLVDSPRQYELLHQQLSDSQSNLASTLKQIVVERPRQFDAWQIYIDVLVSRGDVETLRTVASTLSGESQLPPAIAAELIRQLVLSEAGPDDLDTRLALGRRLQSAVHPRDHSDPRWIRMQATLSILSGQAVESLAVLDRLSQQQRHQLAVLLIRAKALSDLDRLTEVVSILQPLALQFPQMAAIQTPLGYAYSELGQLDNAERAYRASLNALPEDSETLEGLANVLIRQGEHSEAEGVVQQLVERNPESLSLISLQIQIAKARQDKTKIAALLERLAQRQTQTEASLMVLVDGYDFLKDYPTVESYAEALLERDASSIVARLGLAKSFLSRNEYVAALQLLKPLQVEMPERVEITVLIGRIQLARSRYELAADALEAVVNSQPTHDEAVMLLAQSLRGMHRMADSRNVLTEFLQKRPHHEQVRFKLWQLDEKSLATSVAAGESVAAPAVSMNLKVSATLEIARAMMDKGDFGSAKLYALNAVVKEPQGAEPRLVLADILVKMEQFDEAKSNLQTLVKDHPTLIAPYHALLKLFVLSHQLEDGLRAARGLESINYTLAIYLRGLIQLALGREKPAMLAIEQALALAVQNENRAAIQIADTLARLYQKNKYDERVAPMYARLFEVKSLATEARLQAMGQGREIGLTPQMAHQLGLAAKTVPSDRKDLMAALLLRFDESHQGELVLALLEKWIETDPQDLHLLRAKAEILSKMARAAAAIATIENALAIDPQDLQSWRFMVDIYMRESNFPAAKQAIDRMAQLDEHAALEAILLSAALYEQAGLSHQAARVADRAAKLKMPRDSGRLFRLGQMLNRYGYKDKARECYAQVAEGSPVYVAAEIEAIKLAFDYGDKDTVRDRFHELWISPTMAVRAAEYVLARHASIALHEAWLVECDQQIRIEILPDTLRNRWLKLRAQLLLAKRDWPGAVAILTSLHNSGSSSPKLDAARAVLLVYLGQCEQAATILSQSELSAWLPYVCSDQLPVHDIDHPNDSRNFHNATDWLVLPPSATTFYAADIQDEVREDRSQCVAFKDKYQRIGLAQLAMHIGLANLAEDIAKGLYVAYGDSVLMQSVLVDAQLLQGENAQPAMEKLIELYPKSSRVSVELTQRQLARQDMKAAKDSLDILLTREPQHGMGNYLQAKLYFAQGNYELGIAMMDSLELSHNDGESNSRGGHLLIAAMANDFAFELARHDTSRLDDALAMARLAVSLAPQSAATLDTLGWVSHLNGNQPEAFKYLYLALSLAPTNVTIHEHVALWHQSQHQDGWARYHRQQILSCPAQIELSEAFKYFEKNNDGISSKVANSIEQQNDEAARRTLLSTRS